jgi:hypothetical protein
MIKNKFSTTKKMLGYKVPDDIGERTKQKIADVNGSIVFHQVRLEPFFLVSSFYTTKDNDRKLTRHISNKDYYVFIDVLQNKIAKLVGEEPCVVEDFSPFRDNTPYDLIVTPFLWKDRKGDYRLKISVR